MDLTQSAATDGHSLGFSSQFCGIAPPLKSSRSSRSDSSISFRIEEQVRDPCVNPVFLMDSHEAKVIPSSNAVNERNDVEEEEEKVEEFRILGQSILKRKCDSDSKHSPTSSSNEARVEKQTKRNEVTAWGNQSLRNADTAVFEIMEKEKTRQHKWIELIASENFVCRAVMEALGSHLTNKYSEGMPGARYYGGNEYIDKIETLCCERALAAFGLDSENWGVNVQAYSCTSANFAVFTALLSPGDRIMALANPCGGNTSHGCCLPNGKKMSAASIFYQTLAYKANPQTGYIDYEKLEENAVDIRPKILICGGSSYPREWDYARFRDIADKCGAVLLCDMAQISGLIAAKVSANPFEYCDIVTSTTHKTLRGPRGGIIFYRKGQKPRKRGGVQSISQGGECSDRYDIEEKINFAIFPVLQGGPHNNHIAALAVALKQVATTKYKLYMQQVRKNAQALASALLRRNCRLITGGTDNHMLIWDLRNFGLTGKQFEKICELCCITVNKVTVFDDNGHLTLGGVRIGTPAMTSRGCIESDFEVMAEFLLTAVQITISVKREHGKLSRSFLLGLEKNKEISELQAQVESFTSQFGMPGFDV